MKRTSKALLAAFICSFAMAFTACSGSTDSGGSSTVSGTSTVSAVESQKEQPSGSTPESTASDPTSSPESTPESAPESDALSRLWDNAQYTEDPEIGEGAHSVFVEVKIGGRSVTLTVKSDKDNLADMLTENKLVDGDTSEYGLYIKKVNGVTADYDTDGAYWGLNKDGEPSAVGASFITVNDGEHYELVYTSADAFDTAA